MRCSQCGFDNDSNYNFCGRCGSQLQYNEPRTLRLKCQDCNGTMNIDENNMILFCPYCGSKRLIMESDSVKVEKIKSQTVLGKEQILKDRSLEEKRLAFEQQKYEDKDTNRSLLVYFIFIAAIIVFAMIMANGGPAAPLP